MSESLKTSTVIKEQYIRKVGKHSQVTIPKKIVNCLHIDEGDQVRVGMLNDCIIIEPVRVVPKGALYYKYDTDNEYITIKDLEEAVAEAERDYKEGKLKTYQDAIEIFKENDRPTEGNK